MKSLSLFALVLLGLLVPTLVAEDAAKPMVELAKGFAEAQKKLLEKFDLDKNGVLSDAEKLKAQEELKKFGATLGGGLPAGFPGAEELLKKFDKNGDGKLSDAEKLTAQAAMQQIRRGGGPVAGPGFGGGLPAGAAGAAAGDVEEKPARKPNPLIKLYDLDGDGKLNAEEKAALQADRGKKKAKDKGKDAKAKKKAE